MPTTTRRQKNNTQASIANDKASKNENTPSDRLEEPGVGSAASSVNTDTISASPSPSPSPMHKNPPKIRPIVSGCQGPTERISSFLDLILQPIV